MENCEKSMWRWAIPTSPSPSKRKINRSPDRKTASTSTLKRPSTAPSQLPSTNFCQSHTKSETMQQQVNEFKAIEKSINGEGFRSAKEKKPGQPYFFLRDDSLKRCVELLSSCPMQRQIPDDPHMVLRFASVFLECRVCRGAAVQKCGWCCTISYCR